MFPDPGDSDPETPVEQDGHGIYNTFIPISRLPVEFLAGVFAYCSPQSPPCFLMRWGYRDLPYRWLAFTHVCRHWRKVALSCPTLWARIFVTSRRDYMEAMLARSGEAPLSIHAESSSPESLVPNDEKFYSNLAMLLDHIHRARTVRVSLLNHVFNMLPWLPEHAATKPAFLLRELVLHGPHRDNWAEPSPPILKFHADLPNLRRLEVTQYHFQSLRQLFRPSITSLYIDTSSVDSKEIPLIALLTIMEEMPLLESFRLGTLDFEHDVYPASHPVRMNRLRSLRLYVFIKSALWLLEHLRLPALSSVFFECLQSGSQTMERQCCVLNTVVSKLLDAHTGPSTPCIRSLAIHTHKEQNRTRVRGWTEVQSMNSIWHDHPPSLFDICLPEYLTYEHNALYGMVAALPQCPFVSSVQTLSVGCQYGSESHGVVDHVAQPVHSMPKVTSLGFWNWYERNVALLATLRWSNSAERAGEEGNILVPSLETLALQRVCFSGPYAPPRNCDTLTVALQKRQARLAGVKKLVPDKCFWLPLRMTHGLQDSVGEIQWQWMSQNVDGWDERWKEAPDSEYLLVPDGDELA